jgi:ferredoxin
VTSHLRVDPIACSGHGLCAELFPEWIELDDWGYPIVDERPIPPELVEHARRAAGACPTFALLLETQESPRS